MAAWRLPTEFLRMLLSTMPIVTTFSVNQEVGSRSLEGDFLIEPHTFICSQMNRPDAPQWSIPRLELLSRRGT